MFERRVPFEGLSQLEAAFSMLRWTLCDKLVGILEYGFPLNVDLRVASKILMCADAQGGRGLPESEQATVV